MVGSYFFAHNQIMDIKKLYEIVIKNEDVHGIPMIHILTVLNAVLDAIGTGECFYETEHD